MRLIAVSLDYARLGLAQAITIANERIQKLLDSMFSGLPSGLRARDDLVEDGLAVIGHGSISLAAESHLLAAPVTLDQTTSSPAEGIEDKEVMLAPLAAWRLDAMAGHATRLAAVELIAAAQAVDLCLLAADPPSPLVRRARDDTTMLLQGTSYRFRSIRPSVGRDLPGLVTTAGSRRRPGLRVRGRRRRSHGPAAAVAPEQ